MNTYFFDKVNSTGFWPAVIMSVSFLIVGIYAYSRIWKDLD